MNTKKWLFWLALVMSILGSIVVFILSRYLGSGEDAAGWVVFVFTCVWILYLGVRWIVKGCKCH